MISSTRASCCNQELHQLSSISSSSFSSFPIIGKNQSQFSHNYFTTVSVTDPLLINIRKRKRLKIKDEDSDEE